MTSWLIVRTLLRAPRRLLLEAVGVAFPVAMLGATLLFVDASLPTMTRVGLQPVQVEMRALASGIGVDMRDIDNQLANVPGVTRLDRFATAAVNLKVPGQTPIKARLFAVDPSYFTHHRWVRVVNGSFARGVLMAETLRAVPGFVSPRDVTIQVPGDIPDIRLPVGGTADLRDANVWFEIPTGEVQGDVAVVPKAFVVDYTTFDQRILPALRSSSAQTGIGVTNEGGTDLPPVSLEAHITVDHATYPQDPGQAAVWSKVLQKQLEQQTAGAVTVADNAFEALDLARTDASNAKILFLLLGLPGAIAAGALGLAAAAALAEAHRREYALLELRGATPVQLARLGAMSGLVGAAAGIVLGIGAAILGVAALLGGTPWHGIPASRLLFSLSCAIVVGSAIVAIRVLPRLRPSHRPQLLVERRQITTANRPVWVRARLDLVALVVGGIILAVNISSGGLQMTPVEGQIIGQSFFVLLAPIALWIGATLLSARVLRFVLQRSSRPDRARPLGSWPATAVRWLGRRPGRATAAMLLGTLAVAFGTEVVSFVATYNHDVRTEQQAALGSDLRIIPPPDATGEVPVSARDIKTTSAVWVVPARVGSDRKTLNAIDLPSYAKAAMPAPIFTQGGIDALRDDPKGILLSTELAADEGVRVGDPIKVTVFPDAEGRSRVMVFNVDGVYKNFPPSNPFAEAVTTKAILADADLRAPDFILARTTASDPKVVQAQVARSLPAGSRVKGIGQLPSKDRRSLTTLNLGGLGRIAATGAALIAALGVAVLGAFVILERRREAAVLQAIGADTRQLLTHILVEASAVVGGSVVIGVLVGLGLGVLTVRVLGLFFALPAPLLVVPGGALAALVAGTLLGSAVALGVAVKALMRISPAETLREL